MYDTDENQELLHVIEEIRKRDGWTFSKLVHESLKEWRRRHEQNPQTMLFKFSDKPKMNCYCGEAATHEAWNEQEERFYLCEKHLEQNQTARLLKRVRRL